MGRDMLFDMGTCRGTLQGSGGSSRGGCRSAGLSDSSALLCWLGDRDWGSETGGATSGASSDTLANSIISNKNRIMVKT